MNIQRFNSQRIIYWSKLLSKFFSVQVLIQISLAITGIVIIRYLDKKEYALYTISFSMQSSLTMLSELGIASVLMSQGGIVWNNKEQFGSLLNTAYSLRRGMFVAAAIVVVPISFYLLINNGSTWQYAIVISAVMLADLTIKVFTGYKTLVPRLHSDVMFIVLSEAKAQLLRLVLVVISLFSFANTAILGIINFLGSLFHKKLVDNYIKDIVDINAPIDSGYRLEMIKVAKSQLLYTIFYVLQGQLAIIIISYFGNTTKISDIGALSRLSTLLNFFLAVVINFLSPRFAKESSILALRRIFYLCTFLFFTLSSLITAFAVLYPNYFLMLLGQQYLDLNHELILVLAMTLINSYIGVIYTMNYSKTWISHSWIIIPTTISLQIFFATQLNLSIFVNVIYFSILSLLPNLFVNLFMIFKGLKYF